MHPKIREFEKKIAELQQEAQTLREMQEDMRFVSSVRKKLIKTEVN
jgi:hypothetical protein